MTEPSQIPDQRSVDHFFSRLTKELAETFSLTLPDASYVARRDYDFECSWISDDVLRLAVNGSIVTGIEGEDFSPEDRIGGHGSSYTASCTTIPSRVGYSCIASSTMHPTMTF